MRVGQRIVNTVLEIRQLKLYKRTVFGLDCSKSDAGGLYGINACVNN